MNPATRNLCLVNRKMRLGGVFGKESSDRYQFIESEVIRISREEPSHFYVIGDISQFSSEFHQYIQEKPVQLIRTPESLQKAQLALESALQYFGSTKEEKPHAYVYICDIDIYLQQEQTAELLLKLAIQFRMLKWTFTYAVENIESILASAYGRSLMLTTEFVILMFQEKKSGDFLKKMYNIPTYLMNYLYNREHEYKCKGLLKKDAGCPFEPFYQ